MSSTIENRPRVSLIFVTLLPALRISRSRPATRLRRLSDARGARTSSKTRRCEDAMSCDRNGCGNSFSCFLSGVFVRPCFVVHVFCHHGCLNVDTQPSCRIKNADNRVSKFHGQSTRLACHVFVDVLHIACPYFFGGFCNFRNYKHQVGQDFARGRTAPVIPSFFLRKRVYTHLPFTNCCVDSHVALSFTVALLNHRRAARVFAIFHRAICPLTIPSGVSFAVSVRVSETAFHRALLLAGIARRPQTLQVPARESRPNVQGHRKCPWRARGAFRRVLEGCTPWGQDTRNWLPCLQTSTTLVPGPGCALALWLRAHCQCPNNTTNRPRGKARYAIPGARLPSTFPRTEYDHGQES